MRRKWFILVGIAAVTMVMTSPTWAWHEKGHKVVAMIAFKKLKPATRDQVAGLLKHHIAFTTREDGNWPSRIEPGTDVAASLFLLAAIFPDDARHTDAFRDFDDPDAHFIDFPFVPNRADKRNPAIRIKDPTASQNVLRSYHEQIRELKSRSVSDEDKAIALSWVFHLVGDVHQPLHAATLYNENFPRGDRGGNSIKFSAALRRDTHGGKELHGYFDALGDVANDNKHDFATIESMANGLLTTGITPPTGPGHDTIEDWANESFILARRVAYNGLTDADKTLDAFPVGFEADARKTTRQRVTEAGLRLAQVIEDLFP
jgi:hypothetical protein